MRTAGKLSAPQTGRTAPSELSCAALPRACHTAGRPTGCRADTWQDTLDRLCARMSPSARRSQTSPRLRKGAALYANADSWLLGWLSDSGATAAQRARITETGSRELLFERLKVRRALPLQKDAKTAARVRPSLKNTNDP